MRVRYTLKALADLDEIFRYLDERNSAAALSVKELLEARIRMLGVFPRMAPLTDEPAVAELSIVEFPYKIYYEIGYDAVFILHIRHTSRQSWEGKE